MSVFGSGIRISAMIWSVLKVYGVILLNTNNVLYISPSYYFQAGMTQNEVNPVMSGSKVSATNGASLMWCAGATMIMLVVLTFTAYAMFSLKTKPKFFV